MSNNTKLSKTSSVPGRGDALVGAAGLGGVFDDDSRDVDAMLVNARRGGDRVEPGLESGQQFKQVIDGRLAGGQVLQDVGDMAAGINDVRLYK